MCMQPHLAQEVIHDLLLCVVRCPVPLLACPPVIEAHGQLRKDRLQRRVWLEIDLRAGYPGPYHVGQFPCAGDGIDASQQVIDRLDAAQRGLPQFHYGARCVLKVEHRAVGIRRCPHRKELPFGALLDYPGGILRHARRFDAWADDGLDFRCVRYPSIVGPGVKTPGVAQYTSWVIEECAKGKLFTMWIAD